MSKISRFHIKRKSKQNGIQNFVWLLHVNTIWNYMIKHPFGNFTDYAVEHSCNILLSSNSQHKLAPYHFMFEQAFLHCSMHVKTIEIQKAWSETKLKKNNIAVQSYVVTNEPIHDSVNHLRVTVFYANSFNLKETWDTIVYFYYKVQILLLWDILRHSFQCKIIICIDTRCNAIYFTSLKTAST